MSHNITFARKRLINKNLLKHNLNGKHIVRLPYCCNSQSQHFKTGRGITAYRFDFVIRNPVVKISFDYNTTIYEYITI